MPLIRAGAPVLARSAYRRNILINGAMNVGQRNDAALSNAWQYGKADRWLVAASGTGVSGVITQALNGVGSARWGLFVNGCAWTSGAIAFCQRLEAVDVIPCQDNKVSMQVSIYHDLAASMDFEILLVVPTDLDNWAGVNTLHTSPAFPILSGQVTTVSYTFPVLTSGQTWNGMGVIIRQKTANTVTGKTVSITNAQLEIAGTATPFEPQAFADELARCQRYALKLQTIDVFGRAASTTSVVYFVPTPVPMRTSPELKSITIGNPIKYDGTGVAGTPSNQIAGFSPIGIKIGQAGLAVTDNVMYWTTMNELTISAEL
jgi:hypothetical protein